MVQVKLRLFWQLLVYAAYSVATGATYWAGFVGCAFAKEGPSPIPADSVTGSPDSSEGTVVTYGPSYFESFNVVSALDMLRRIPGIQDLLEGSGFGFGSQVQRGFGNTGSPILFNGRRLSGKANDPLDALERLQATQVVRVEVIRGSVPGLDIRIGNEGTLVNVVLEDTLTSSFGSWEAGIEYFTRGHFRGLGKLAYAGDVGPLSYTLSAEISPREMTRYTDDTFVLPPSEEPFGRIRLINRTRGNNYTGAASLTYAFDNGDIANLNGLISDENRINTQPLSSFTILSPGNEVFTGSSILSRDQAGDLEWEIGGDYEHRFDDGDSWRALFVVTSDKSPLDINFFSTAPSEPQIQTLKQLVKADRSERILRGYYNWAIAEGHALEVGGEVALNKLDQNNQQFTEVDGTLVPIDLFNSDSKVSETRLESFTRHSWQISPTLYTEAAVDTEYSRLKQRGSDVSTTRSFFFVKPRLDLRYDLSPGIQLRGRVLRDISQLDFSNFVSTINTNDVRVGVIQAGNPDLVPEKTWTFEVTGEYRLPNDQGVLTLRTFYDDITDNIDKILIIPEVAGEGNIGSAYQYGAELKVGIRLDGLGLEGASVDANGLLQDSSVTDSFTGEKRPLQSFRNWEWSVSYRHDTQWRNLSYGASIEGNDARFGSDIDFTQQFKFRTDWTLFAEIPLFGLTFRLEIEEDPRVVTRDRLQFVGNRANNNILRRELRFDTFDTQVNFIVKGTF